MCSKTKCNKCNGITWDGCGNHLTTILIGVKINELCKCNKNKEAKAKKAIENNTIKS